MKKTVLILFTLFIGLTIYGQRRVGNNTGIPQDNAEPTEQEIAKRQRIIEERKAEFIDNFLTTLEADNFQKEIIKQSLFSFFDEKLAILKTPFERSFDRQQAVKKLEDTHFKDLEELISKGDMEKLNEMVTGGFDDKELIKEKKKKKKRNRKKDKS